MRSSGLASAGGLHSGHGAEVCSVLCQLSQETRRPTDGRLEAHHFEWREIGVDDLMSTVGYVFRCLKPSKRGRRGNPIGVRLDRDR